MKEIDENEKFNEVKKEVVREGKDTDFVNAAEAHIVLMNGMINFLEDNRLRLLEQVTPAREKFRFISYTELEKSFDNCIKVLKNDKSGFQTVAKATDDLIEKTNEYMRDWSSGNEGFYGPITHAFFIVEDLNKKLECFRTAYTNTRVMLSYTKGFGNTSLAAVKRKKTEVAVRAKKSANKEYNFDSMCMMAEYQNKIRKNVKRFSFNFNNHYSRDSKKDSYMLLKKKPKVNDLAKYFVLSEVLDKAFSPEITLASSVNDLKTIKALEDKYTTKRIQKDIDDLAKNQLFLDCLKNKGNKAFSSWAVVEKKTDKFVSDYEEALRLMGGTDITLLIEQAMGVRQLASDRLEDVLANESAVADLKSKAYLFPRNEKNIGIMTILVNDYLSAQEFDEKGKIRSVSQNGNISQEMLLEAKKQAAEDFSNISMSVYNNVSKIIALQILSNPKNRQFLNECAIANKKPEEVLNELTDYISKFIENKNAFDYDLGAKGDEKCFNNVKKILKDTKFKTTIFKEYQAKQAAAKLEQKNPEVNKEPLDLNKMINIAKSVKKGSGRAPGMN